VVVTISTRNQDLLIDQTMNDHVNVNSRLDDDKMASDNVLIVELILSTLFMDGLSHYWLNE
jgi:hypothetical protein